MPAVKDAPQDSRRLVQGDSITTAKADACQATQAFAESIRDHNRCEGRNDR